MPAYFAAFTSDGSNFRVHGNNPNKWVERNLSEDFVHLFPHIVISFTIFDDFLKIPLSKKNSVKSEMKEKTVKNFLNQEKV